MKALLILPLFALSSCTALESFAKPENIGPALDILDAVRTINGNREPVITPSK